MNLRPSGYEPDELPTAPPRGEKSKWWREKDSNLRRRSRQIYSLLPLATREPLHLHEIILCFGAGERNRTPNLLITNQLLCQLSYTSVSEVITTRAIVSCPNDSVNGFSCFFSFYFKRATPRVKFLRFAALFHHEYLSSALAFVSLVGVHYQSTLHVF